MIKTGIAELDMIKTQLQANGRTATVTTNKVSLRNTDGEIVGVLGTFADITERRRADAAMRENEYKFRMLLKSMREGIMQVDQADNIIFLNDCFCDMVGYSFEELMETDWRNLLFDDEGGVTRQTSQRTAEALCFGQLRTLFEKKIR